jgi:GH43 family beta-xylosidase
MKLTDINIRDPFILNENGKFCLYGTRARNFGVKVGGFDVYVSDDLENWSDPVCCFDSEKYEMNRDVNWAPEVHKYKGAYYIFATFTQPNGNRATYALKSDSPLGPFAPWSDGPLTPSEWFSLDGTLLIDEGVPYLVFCHEHVQIKDGTVEYLRLSDDLKKAVSEPKTIFKGSSPYFIEDKENAERYVTDGPFLYRTTNGELLMIWSTFINGKYAQCLAKSSNAHIDGEFVHLPPLITDDGGHGMVFRDGERLCLTFHTPNQTDYERPVIIELVDTGDGIELKKE